MATKITATIPLPGLHFGADFYVKAVIEVTHFGSAEYIPPYNRPDLYDPGGGPDWTVAGTPELFLDSGGDGEPVAIGPEFAAVIETLLTTDKAAMEAVESQIAKFAEAE
jgi:hypothetical protein